MTTRIPNPASLGVAKFNQEEFSQINVFFATGIPRESYRCPLADATKLAGIAAWTVVGFDDDGNIVPAKYNATAADEIKAIGITVAEIPAGSSADNIPVVRSAHININAVVWDATFTTDALKLNAFEGAPTPTLMKTGTNEFDRV